MRFWGEFSHRPAREDAAGSTVRRLPLPASGDNRLDGPGDDGLTSEQGNVRRLASCKGGRTMNDEWRECLEAAIEKLRSAQQAYAAGQQAEPDATAGGLVEPSGGDAREASYRRLACDVREARHALDTGALLAAHGTDCEERVDRLQTGLARLQEDRADIEASLVRLGRELDAALGAVRQELAGLRDSPAADPRATSRQAELETLERVLVFGTRSRLARVRNRLERDAPFACLDSIQKTARTYEASLKLAALEKPLEDASTRLGALSTPSPTDEETDPFAKIETRLKAAKREHLGSHKPFEQDGEMACAEIAAELEEAIRGTLRTLSESVTTIEEIESAFAGIKDALVAVADVEDAALRVQRRRLRGRIDGQEAAARDARKRLAESHERCMTRISTLHNFLRRVHQARATSWFRHLKAALFKDPLRASGFVYAVLTVVGMLYLIALSVSFGFSLDEFGNLQIAELAVVGAQYGMVGLLGLIASVALAVIAQRRVLRTAPERADEAIGPACGAQLRTCIEAGLAALERGPRIPREYKGHWLQVCSGVVIAAMLTVVMAAWKPSLDEYFGASALTIYRDKQPPLSDLVSLFKSNSHEWFYDRDTRETYRFARSDLRCVQSSSVRGAPTARCLQEPAKSVPAADRIATSLEQFLGTGPVRGTSDPVTLRELASAWQATMARQFTSRLDAIEASIATSSATGDELLKAYFAGILSARQSRSDLPPFMEEFRACHERRVNTSRPIAVHFGINSAEPVDEFDSREFLAAVNGRILRGAGTRGMRIYLAGFASPTGTMAHNLYLSKQRIRTVKRLLLDSFPGLDVRYVPFGEQWSAALGGTAAAHDVNDRESDEARVVQVFGCRLVEDGPAASGLQTTALAPG